MVKTSILLRRISDWTSSIQESDIRELEDTPELLAFLDAFDGLQNRHHRTIHEQRQDLTPIDVSEYKGRSSLLISTNDEILHRIFDFLDAQSLARTMRTSKRIAAQIRERLNMKLNSIIPGRRLTTALQYLRADEQIRGIENETSASFVRVPFLLLNRRLQVSDCGHLHFNGIYHCTGCNGNGYVFTQEARECLMDEPYTFRSTIEKKYSETTLLWYFRYELIHSESGRLVEAKYMFWGKPLTEQDGAPALTQYPSQTSLMLVRGPGWQRIGEHIYDPPTLEFYD